MKIRELLKRTKKDFRPPKKRYYFGRIQFGTPYMHPRSFVSTILKIVKLENKPRYNRNKNFDLLGYNISIGTPVFIYNGELGWKDKFNSPRLEWSPCFILYLFKWQFCIFWSAPDSVDNRSDDEYYEMILWYLYYADSDIVKAEQTWPWTNAGTKESTWKNKYIISNEHRRTI
jgi:hypothetical protein